MRIFKFNLQRFVDLTNTSGNKSLAGTNDADNITNSGNVVTISAGEGRDTVSNSGNIVQIFAGVGHDLVDNNGNNVTIDAGAGHDTVRNGNDNYLSGVLGSTVAVALGDGNDYFSNGRGSYVTITGGAGKDTVNMYYNGGYGDHSYIDLGDDDDSLGGYSGSYSTIFGGNGNDSINLSNSWATNQSVVIFGDDGNDRITEVGKYSTVTGGTGNDYIHLTRYKSSGFREIDYVYGDGGDTIEGFNSTDELHITTPSAFSTVQSNNDFYILFDNNQSITLLNVAGLDSSNLVVVSSGGGEPKPPTPEPADPTPTQPTVPAEPTSSKGGGDTINISNETNTTVINVFNGFPLASNMFGFFGGQSNTVSKFVTGRGSNANVLAFGTSLTSINRTSSYMSFNAADGSTLRVNNSSSVNEAIQYTTDGKNISYAKVGYAEKNNSFTYEDGVNFYSGGSHTDVLNVTNYQSRNIWLDGSAGVGYSGINNINAAQSSGNNTLAGDGGNNQITAGKGNDSLWGGSGSSEDVLIGGSGQNMFWYGKGDGNDQVQKAKTGDVINLYDVTLADITTAGFNGSAISVGFNTGFNLNVNVSSNLSSTFRLADGSNWQYNKSAGNWQSA